MGDEKRIKIKRITIVTAIYAAIFLLFMYISNNDTISSWFGSIFSVLSPFIIGFVFVFLFNPLLELFENKIFAGSDKEGEKKEKRTGKRILSMICTYFVIILALILITFCIAPQLVKSYNTFASNLNSYIDKAVTFVNKLLYRLNTGSEGFFSQSYIDIDAFRGKIGDILWGPEGILTRSSGRLLSYATSALTGVKNVLLGLFISIYMFATKDYLVAQIRRFFVSVLYDPDPEKDKSERFFGLMTDIRKTFSNYIRAQLLDALVIALECAIIFSLTGMPYAVLLAFIIGVTNIIPIFGPFIGGIPCGFIIFIAKPEKLLLYIILILIIQQIDGHIVLPKLVGSSTGMTSFGVLCAITIAGGYFGLIGMVLGVPMFLVISRLVREFIVDPNLGKKGKSPDLDGYYSEGALKRLTEEEKEAIKKKKAARLKERLDARSRKRKKKDFVETQNSETNDREGQDK